MSKPLDITQRLESTWRGRDGIIYFIDNREADMVKIGFTGNLPRRLETLQTGNHVKLRLVTSFRSCELSERLIQDHFQEHRVSGEWFRLTSDLEEFWDDLMDYQSLILGAHMHEDWKPLSPEAVGYILSTIGKKWDDAELERLAA